MHTYLGDRGEALEEREARTVIVGQRSPPVQFSVCVFGLYCI